MFNEKYSHGKKFNFDSSKNVFISLKEYTTKFPGVIRVWGLMTYEGKKGLRCALITDGYNVNLPEHLLKDVESIMATPDEVAAINEGKCGFTVSSYEDTKYGNGTCYTGSFCDV